MTRAEMIAVLAVEQADDDATIKVHAHRREIQASRLESDTLPDWLDSQRDPNADTVGEAIANEALDRWGAEDDAPGKGWPPSRPKETVGLGMVGWCLETEGAGLLGRSCPCCGDDPGPGRYCLACTRAGKRLESFLARLRSHDGEVPEQWRHIETAPGRALVRDAIAAQEERQVPSLAARRFASREARKGSQGPPKSGRIDPHRRVAMVSPSGQVRDVRSTLVTSWERLGWRVA